MVAEGWDGESGASVDRSGTTEKVSSLDGTLVLALTRAARLFATQLNDDLLLAGLTGPQWLALHEVVRRLVNQRLVTREQACLDGRLRVYLATDSGVRAAVRGAAGARRATDRATGGFTPDERALLTALLERVVGNLAGLRPGLDP